MTTIDQTKLTGIVLQKGSHESPGDGLCYLEWLAFVTGTPHTDHPPCVSPVLGEMGRGLNDVLPDGLRQQLLVNPGTAPVGTAGDGRDEERSYMALDWLIRTWLPAWLELSPACREAAARVRELGRIVDLASAERAGPVVREAKSAAYAARAAEGAAAWAAEAYAEGAAEGAAAWAAGGAAAWAAAGAAEAYAEGAAEGAAAWAAGGAAAWAAAGDVLQTTTTALQQSAIDLYARMARVGGNR